jgi:hypothetical protein
VKKEIQTPDSSAAAAVKNDYIVKKNVQIMESANGPLYERSMVKYKNSFMGVDSTIVEEYKTFNEIQENEENTFNFMPK